MDPWESFRNSAQPKGIGILSPPRYPVFLILFLILLFLILLLLVLLLLLGSFGQRRCLISPPPLHLLSTLLLVTSPTRTIAFMEFKAPSSGLPTSTGPTACLAGGGGGRKKRKENQK